MKAKIFAAVICTAVISQINPASAQYYGPLGGYYYYGSPAAVCCALTPVDLGWALTRSQPAGNVAPYPALRMADGTLGCEHSQLPTDARRLVSAHLVELYPTPYGLLRK